VVFFVEPHGSHIAGDPRFATIERLAAGDGERLRAIRLRALKDSPDAFGTTFKEAAAQPPESWELQLEQLATFVATTNGCDVGLVRGTAHERCRDAGCLISMWVAREARRQGIGSALIDALAEWAGTQGWDRLLLDVGERNTPALALYTRKDFVPTGEIGALPPPRDHLREVQLVMRL
jgi:GNAT superfamily N-acetyltransferase